MENPEQKSTLAHLDQLPAMKLAEDERVAAKFIDLYNRVHGNHMGKHIYEVEKFHFVKAIAENKDLQACSKLSLYGAFLVVAVQGLSFDPTKRLCYLIFNNHNVGTKDNPKWEKRAQLNISPYGELYLRQYYGQIQTADNPVVVYEGDDFEVITGSAGRIVNHRASYPRKSNRIIACFLRIVKNDGSIDFGIMDELEMARLAEYSKKKNKGQTNKLYGEDGKQFDTGFLIAKTIKHAFKAYPKVKLRGQFTQLETEVVEENIDYGLDERPAVTAPAETQPAIEQPQHQPIVQPVVNTANEKTVQMTVTRQDEDDMF